MIGAIIDDIAGSTYEFHSIKAKDFPLFAPGEQHHRRQPDEHRCGQRTDADRRRRRLQGKRRLLHAADRSEVPLPDGRLRGALPALAGFAKSPTLRQLWERLRDARVPMRGCRRHAGRGA